MIFLAEAKMHNALMNSLNASICGFANCSGLYLHLNIEFSVNAVSIKEGCQAHCKISHLYFMNVALNSINI